MIESVKPFRLSDVGTQGTLHATLIKSRHTAAPQNAESSLELNPKVFEGRS